MYTVPTETPPQSLLARWRRFTWWPVLPLAGLQLGAALRWPSVNVPTGGGPCPWLLQRHGLPLYFKVSELNPCTGAGGWYWKWFNMGVDVICYLAIAAVVVLVANVLLRPAGRSPRAV
jgi:hypothetical protein